MSRVTVVDVAEHAGVSRSTVSLVLNESPLVAERTKQRVRASMVALDYVYDRSAAALRRSRTDAVGLILTEFTHPYLARFADGAQEVLEKAGVIIFTGVSHEDPRQQERLARAMLERRLDGLIVIPAIGSTAADLAPFAGSHLVVLARQIPGLDADYVGIDNDAAIREVVAHLADLHGRVRFAFVGGDPASSPHRERVQGLDAALRDRGLPPAGVHPCAQTRTASQNLARALLVGAGQSGEDLDASAAPGIRRSVAGSTPGAAAGTAPPSPERGYDAVIAYSDIVALGFMDVAAELGIAVGTDVSVVGFDDIPEAEYARWPLTTVGSPGEVAGRIAGELLRRRLGGDRTPPERVLLESSLVVRASCGCVPVSPSSPARPTDIDPFLVGPDVRLGGRPVEPIPVDHPSPHPPSGVPTGDDALPDDRPHTTNDSP